MSQAHPWPVASSRGLSEPEGPDRYSGHNSIPPSKGCGEVETGLGPWKVLVQCPAHLAAGLTER